MRRLTRQLGVLLLVPALAIAGSLPVAVACDFGEAPCCACDRVADAELADRVDVPDCCEVVPGDATPPGPARVDHGAYGASAIAPALPPASAPVAIAMAAPPVAPVAPDASGPPIHLLVRALLI